jgi:hypothetical protein
MTDYPTLVDAREAVNDFHAAGGGHGFSDVLLGAAHLAHSIDRLADQLEETNRLLTIIATNTENL